MPWPNVKVVLIHTETTGFTSIGRHMKLNVSMGDKRLGEIDSEGLAMTQPQ